MKIEINLQLLKNSAKKTFCDLRDKSPLNCTQLSEKIVVSKRFFTHIAKHPKRTQNLKDLAERLLIIPFVNDILNNGNIVNIRTKRNEKYFRISKKYKKITYTVIVIKTKKIFFLVSCFIDWENKK